MNFKGDIAGGLTAGVIALPLALAFGIASGLGAAAGVWGAIVLGFFAAIFGGTKVQVSGPTGPMTVVSAAIAFKFANDLNIVMAIFVMAGLLQILFGVLRLGRLIKFIPYSVVSGFMNGIGAIIILLQINPLLGQASVGSVTNAILQLPTSLANLNPHALILALATIAILYLTPKILSRIVPTPLIALLILTPLCAFLSLDVATIGQIPTGLPNFIIPHFELTHFITIISYALILALLGSIDSLLTSLVADSITGTKHSSNQELVGQGLGNALVGFVGGIPGAGATMRTVANIKAGGSGRLSGATHSLFLLFCVLAFAPIVGYVPLAVLAGILVKVGIDILDYRLLRRITKIPKKDAAVMLTVFFLTLFFDLIFAVFVGVALAYVCYFFDVSRENKKFDIKILDEQDAKFVNIIGPMFFGNTSKIIQSLNPLAQQKHITIDCSKATFMDISFVYALEEFVQNNNSQETRVQIVFDELFSGRALNELKHIMGENVAIKRGIGDDEVI